MNPNSKDSSAATLFPFFFFPCLLLFSSLPFLQFLPIERVANNLVSET
jgi:hypothetical protein